MQIKVKQDPETNQCFLDINDFKSLVNIKKVAFYELNEENDSLSLKFYDKNKKLLKIKKPNK